MLSRLRLPAVQRPIELASTSSLLKPLVPFASFSTTPAVAAGVVKKKSNSGQNMPTKGKKVLNIKKKDPTKRERVPLEQKRALQKRIVLSNANASQVGWLQDLTKDNMTKEATEGKVYGLPDVIVDALRLVKAFKPGQGWASYRRPASLIRREAWQLGRAMKAIAGDQSSGDQLAQPGETLKRIVYGPRGAGKSVLLLQAMTMAFLRGWIVINIPEGSFAPKTPGSNVRTIGRELIDASSDYALVPDSTPPQYAQNSLIADIISRMIEGNKTLFFAMKLSRTYDIPVRNEPNMTLYEFGRIATLNTDLAWPIFRALWHEINLQSSPEVDAFGKRPPILLCVDNISHIFGLTKYQVLNKEDALSPIHSYDMVLPKLVIDCLTGEESFGNGGVVMGATSGSDRVTCHPLEAGIKLAESKQKSPDSPASLADVWNPYDRIDRRVLDSMMDLKVLRLSGVSKDEARQIIEYWAYNGVVRDRVADDWVSDRWTMSGGGLMGELEKAVVHMRF
jgi:small subunit ribosomal protein S29